MASNINTVGRRRAPGVKVNRVQAQSRVVGVAVADAGMIGIAKKGPTNKRLVITDYEHYIDRYGDLYNNNYMAPCAKEYFDAGGDNLHCVRVVGSGAAVASAMLRTYDGLTNTVLVQNLDKGAGFVNEIDTVKATASLTTALTSASTTFTLDTINSFEQGDLVQFGGTTAGATAAFVQSINTSTKTITCLAPAGMSGTWASGTKVYVATRHKIKTSLSEDYASGASVLKLTSTAGVFQGQRLYVSDGTNHASVLVRSVNGSSVILDASAAVSISATGSFVVSQEFSADVYEDGVLADTHEYLSMEDSATAPNSSEHIEVKLSGDNNESVRIKMTDQDAEGSFTPHSHLTGFKDIMAIPVTYARVRLTGGADGATPTASEWTGVSTNGSESGLYLYNGTQDARFLAMPGQTDATAIRTAMDYCENHSTKGNCQYVIDAPLASVEVDDVLAFRNITLARSTAYGVLLYPWAHIQHPSVSGGSFTVPLSANWMGAAARAATNVGIRQAPAGVEDGRLNASVKGLTKVITDDQHALLEEAGIVPARFQERFGFYFYGAKTLTRTFNGFEWIPAQLMYNFIAASLAEFAQPFVFKPNNDDTRDRLGAAIENFMKSMFDNGEFVPQDDPSQAYYVKCDSENNPDLVTQTGNLVCDVGFQTPTPAGFISFRLGRTDGKVTVTQNNG